MILHVKIPKNLHKPLFRLINKLSNISGHKINTQKSAAFLYTNNEQSEKGIKKIVAFKIAERIKCLEINLTKEVKDLCTYNAFLKKIKEV